MLFHRLMTPFFVKAYVSVLSKLLISKSPKTSKLHMGFCTRRKLSQGGHVRREGVKCLSSLQEESSLGKSHWGIPWETPLGKTGVRAPCKGANVFLPSGGQVFQGAIALSEAGGQVLQGGSVCSVTTLFFRTPFGGKIYLQRSAKE